MPCPMGECDRVDQLLGVHAEQCGTEDLVGLVVQHDFIRPRVSSTAYALGMATISATGCLAIFPAAGRAGFPLGQSDGGQRRCHEQRVRYRDAVGGRAPAVTAQRVEHDPAVVQRDVGELRAPVDVTEGENVRLARPEVLVDLDGTRSVTRTPAASSRKPPVAGFRPTAARIASTRTVCR
jgi:hypothetical protein